MDRLDALLREERGHQGLVDFPAIGATGAMGEAASEEQVAEIISMADKIKAQLKKQGIKRLRALKRGDSRVFNIGYKSIPNAPDNLVAMANMVWEPLDKMLKKMGGDGGANGPAAGRYYTFPSGIRVMGGANTGERAVIVRVSGP